MKCCRWYLFTELELKLIAILCPNCLLPGFSKEIDRDEKRNEKLSLRKQLKLKCQEQNTTTPGYEKASYGTEHEDDTTIYQPTPISSYMPAGKITDTSLMFISNYFA